MNPYGIVVVPKGISTNRNSSVNTGDLLISNFNNAANVAGTGTTITRVTPAGQLSNFFTATPNHGLTNALSILQNGIVIVGSLPTINGVPQPGSIIFLDRNGRPIPLTFNGGTQAPRGEGVGELTNTILNAGNRAGPFLNPIQGPWSSTVDDNGTGSASLYVSMVLSGTVLRIDFNYDADFANIRIHTVTQIASGYAHKLDPAGLVLGPAGLAHFTKTDSKGNKHDELYVANSADNTIYMINDAGWTTANVTGNNVGTAINVVETVTDPNTGKTMNVNPLHGPLGLIIAPNGHLLTANSDPAASNDANHPSELIEFRNDGTFISRLSIDPNTGGAFGLTTQPVGTAAWQLVFVNDNQVAVGRLTFPVQ